MRQISRVVLTLLALLACAPFAAAQEAMVRVSAADPSAGGTLAAGDTLYLRISYRSAVPLRFRAKGYNGESEVIEGAAYNPMPVYPAGEHDALVWISYARPARIDEVRIDVKDADWNAVRTLSYPIMMEWRAGSAPRRDEASWAATLSARQQSMTVSAVTGQGQSDTLGSVLMALAAASIPAYICLQIAMLARYAGGWRVAAALPLIGMVPLALYTLAALAMGSGLWPLMLLFLTPPAFLYLIGLWLVRLLSRAVAPS